MSVSRRPQLLSQAKAGLRRISWRYGSSPRFAPYLPSETLGHTLRGLSCWNWGAAESRDEQWQFGLPKTLSAYLYIMPSRLRPATTGTLASLLSGLRAELQAAVEDVRVAHGRHGKAL